MSFDTLGDDIWINVLKFLVPPIPKSLSGLTKQEAIGATDKIRAQLPDSGAPGVTSRSEIRSRDLATLMRVSCAFNRLAAVPLYKTIITDDIGFLVSFNENPPVHPGIERKSRLFRYTTDLHIEYFQKGVTSPSGSVDPTYAEILEDPALWFAFGRAEIEVAVYQSVREVNFLYYNLVQKSSTDPNLIRFPALKRLTVGAIFGGQDEMWMAAQALTWDLEAMNPEWAKMDRSKDLKGPIDACKEAMVAIFSHSPITHFCQRGHLGPLSLPLAFHWIDKTTRLPPPTLPLFTFHHTANRGDTYVPAAIGCRTQWLLDQATPTANFSTLLDMMIGSYRMVNRRRARIWEDEALGGALQLAVYANSVGIKDPSAQEDRMVNEPGTIAQVNRNHYEARTRAAGLKKGEADNFKWHNLTECPPCLACGWVYE